MEISRLISIRLPTFIACVVLVVFVTSCKSGSPVIEEVVDEFTFEFDESTIKFYEVEGIKQADIPPNLEGAYSEEVSLADVNSILGFDFRKCIPDSLKSHSVFTEAGYRPIEKTNQINNELYQINIWIHDAAREPDYGRRIYLSVGSKSWSEGSVLQGRYWYSPVTPETSLVHNGVEVVLMVWPNPVYDDTYIASFSIASSDYDDEVTNRIYGVNFYITGHEGITAEEFIELVIEIIESCSI